MEPVIIMQQKWGQDFLVPMYLFFGGIAAGLFTVAVVADLLSPRFPRWDRIARLGAYATVPCYVIAGLCITFHLGKPERGLLFPFFFTNTDSWMWLGGWAAGLSGPVVVLYAAGFYFRDKVNELPRRIVGVIGIPVLIWLAINTAMLLAGARFVPLWSEAYLPWLFVNSGLLTGLAGVGLIYMLAERYFPEPGNKDGQGSEEIAHSFSYSLLMFELLEIFILYIFFAFLFASPAAGKRLGEFIIPSGGRYAFDYVISGPLAPWFWWGVVVIGLAIPVAISFVNLVVRKWEFQLAITKYALVLVGGVVLRYVIVWGGDLSAPLPFPPQLAQFPPLGG